MAIGAPRNSRPSNGELRERLADSEARNVQGCSSEKIVKSAGWPASNVAFHSQDARWSCGEKLNQPRQRDTAGVEQLFERQRKRRFEARNSKRSAIEFHIFAGRMMRSVIGGNRINGAVGETFEQRFAIFARAERRIHFVA